MRRKRYQLTPFSLSFLDIMSCGFGAAALLFLIIKHNIDSSLSSIDNAIVSATQSEVSLLQNEIRISKKNRTAIKNTINEVNQQIILNESLVQKITVEIDSLNTHQNKLRSDNSSSAQLDLLKSNLIRLEQQKKELRRKLDKANDAARKFEEGGKRTYISGLKMSGKRLLILVDSSASMLDETIVNILRRRNMSGERKRKSPKWQHTIKIVEWLSAKLPLDSQFQIYHFNIKTEALLENTKGKWINVRDKSKLDNAIKTLNNITPSDGTNLAKAFVTANQLKPKPDNIYLITDGLPTQGLKPSYQTTISSQDRNKLFYNAIKELPYRTPVNIILMPIEGDPNAAIAYWRLSQITQGSFMSPSKDWP